MRRLRIFIGSPGDVGEERDLVSLIVEELRRTVARLVSIELETVRWETHAWPALGDDAQDVINREIGDYDVFVGIMWKRFGTRTKRAPSGTAEEFDRAYEYFTDYAKPKIMFYFRAKPFFTTDLSELRQFKKVLEIRRKLQKFGVLYWEYVEPIEFDRRFSSAGRSPTIPIYTPASVITPSTSSPRSLILAATSGSTIPSRSGATVSRPRSRKQLGGPHATHRARVAPTRAVHSAATS